MMIESYDQLIGFAHKYTLPLDEVIFVGLNLCGVNLESQFKRVRFDIEYCEHKLLFSVENNADSPYVIKDSKLTLGAHDLFSVSSVCEDSCEVFYTRKKGRVVCFNPNNRSSCTGCSFCYQPVSKAQRTIDPGQIRCAFEEWMQLNSKTTLSDIEQVAVVTGCFGQDKQIVDYLVKLRESLISLGFFGEILFFGVIHSEKCLKELSELKPIHLCYTIECFERRQLMLNARKCIDLSDIDKLMKKSMGLGIQTSFSYVLGLDSLECIKSVLPRFKNSITSFPIISLYQTDSQRLQYRSSQANDLSYYLEGRRMIEDLFAGMDICPNYWNNYRSPWRTCYGESNNSILPVL